MSMQRTHNIPLQLVTNLRVNDHLSLFQLTVRRRPICISAASAMRFSLGL
jgi:hypothetical protein